MARAGLSSFASASNRSELASKAVPEEVAPGSYNIAGNLAPRAAQPVQYHKYRSNIKSMTALIQPRQPFVGTQRRFIKPVPLDVPGPGASAMLVV